MKMTTIQMIEELKKHPKDEHISNTFKKICSEKLISCHEAVDIIEILVHYVGKDSIQTLSSTNNHITNSFYIQVRKAVTEYNKIMARKNKHIPKSSK